MCEPKPYDLNDFNEVCRFFREMGEYLKTDDFVNKGTDYLGRKYALNAFFEMKETMDGFLQNVGTNWLEDEK